jgi:hypothetical protein
MSLIFCIFLVGFFWFGMMTMKNKMLQKNATEERKKLQSCMTETHDTVNYAFSMLQFM